jgi:uncharacterized protein
MEDKDMLTNLATVHPDHWSKPFWDAAARHQLVCQRCTNCGNRQLPPAPVCWNCQHQDFEYVELPGTGTVFSRSSTYVTVSPKWIPEDELPFTVLIVDLDGAPGCRLIGAVARGSEDPEIGAAVRVQWEDVPDAATVARFIPA